MTSIHAQIPEELKDAVKEARRRGNEGGDNIPEVDEEQEERPSGLRTTSSSSSVVMKKRPAPPKLTPTNSGSGFDRISPTGRRNDAQAAFPFPTQDEDESDEEEDAAAASKENDPSLSPSPVSPAPPSPRRNILGKRPLSALPTPIDPDLTDGETDEHDVRSPSDQNIANNVSHTPQQPQQSTAPARKSPKLSELSKGVNASGRIRDDVQIYEDSNTGEGKENLGSGGEKSVTVKKAASGASTAAPGVTAKPAAARKVSTTSTSSGKGKARAGLRRL